MWVLFCYQGFWTVSPGNWSRGVRKAKQRGTCAETPAGLTAHGRDTELHHSLLDISTSLC